ncbi:porin family protein [Mucilaginibacter sp. dw_454]|uniref:porin family protein n=1 Tax=Mucilaginibacter sp. dw_454 TaxID=2720079 RepID=UPI001BD3A446|nr:porin family protein [Mucilaginibacter sp. dw_454]
MSNRNQHHELWQQKRNELPVNGDIKTDWSEMHDLLDQNMPVGGSNGGGSNTGAQLMRLAKFKLLYVAAGLILGGAITYVLMHHEQNNPINKNHKANKTVIRKDSTTTNSTLQTNSPAGQIKPTADSSANAASNSVVDEPEANAADVNGSLASSNKDASHRSTENKGASIFPSSYHNHLKGLSNNARLNDYHQAINYHSENNNNGSPRSLVSIPRQAINDSSSTIQNRANNNSLLLLPPAPIPSLTWEDIVANTSSQPKILANPFKPARQLSVRKKTKATKQMSGDKLDWGLLLGVNSNGSFTPKVRNTNFYGSLPVDIYVGLFTTYNLNNQWAIGAQGRFLTPHTSAGSYDYSHTIDVEGFKTVQTFKINNSRKAYTIDVPVHLIYRATPNISIKAGPLLSIPMKDVNRITFTDETYGDTTQYVNAVKSYLKSVSYENKLRYGISAGAGYSYRRLSLDATYSYYPQSQKVSSSLGTFTQNTNNLQITLGIKLNKQKK